MADHFAITKSSGLRGTCEVPGDKSISHRSVILGAIADGTSRASNFLTGQDCQATRNALAALGVKTDLNESSLVVEGVGLRGLCEPSGPVDCDNSGTTMRLLCGLLAGQPWGAELIGTKQLEGRPMNRIVDPLLKMGASITSHSGTAPLQIRGIGTNAPTLRGMRHEMTVASAQVKSGILLAGLYADGITEIVEKGPTRDHTERMLGAMGADIQIQNERITLRPNEQPLRPFSFAIPGDPSSAAFPMVAASIVPNSCITLRNVGINPTRAGIVHALRRMGGRIEPSNESNRAGEPTADLTVHHAPLRGATFDGDEIVTMIDELQILAVAATQARGTTVIRGAKELRVKETDRIATTASELRALGAQIEELDDGMTIEGGRPLRGSVVKSHGDHRAAMLLAVAGLVATGETIVHDASVTKDSFPGFRACLGSLGASIRREQT